MKKKIFIFFFITFCFSLSGATYYVSPNGSDSNPGTINQPFYTLNRAWDFVSAGDIIYMRGGTYSYKTTTTYLEHKRGTSGSLIKIWAYPGEHPVIDYSGIDFTSQKMGIFLNDISYVHLKGIRICNMDQVNRYDAPPNYGLLLYNAVSNCIFEMMETDHIGGWGVSFNDDCSNNLFLNCDSHHNEDPYSYNPYGGSDGFQTSSNTTGHTSTNNIFRGCRAWFNSDDGWDLRQADGVYILENCWSFWNGFIPDTWDEGGNGDGYKLGGKSAPATNTILRTIKNSVAFGNRGTGITPEPDGSDLILGVAMYNCVAYNNAIDWGSGISSGGYGNVTTIKNCIDYDNNGNEPDITNQTIHEHNSFDLVVKVTDADFLSVDPTGIDGPRNEDGSLPDINFLHLAPGSDLIDAGVNVGISYSGNNPDLGAFEFQTGSTTIPIPVYISSVIEDATPSLLELTYNLTLSSIVVPAASSFSVSVNSLSRAINAVSISGSKVRLTLSAAVKFGDIISVSYTKPANNPLQTASGGEAASISARPVTNHCTDPAVPNDPPVIAIKNDAGVFSGFVYDIDASGTSDPNNDVVTYTWTVPNNIDVLSKALPYLRFLAPIVEIPQVLEFQLKVTDGTAIVTKVIPIKIVPYKPELDMARITAINASSYKASDYPKNVADENLTTKWSAVGDNQWLSLRLAEPFKISHLEIAFLPGQRNGYKFDIYASNDNVIWEPVFTNKLSWRYSGYPQIFEFPILNKNTEYSFIKLIGHGSIYDNLVNISEFKIFGSLQPKGGGENQSRNVIIYPNPARDFFNISIEEPSIVPDLVSIIDFSGKTVFEESFEPGINNIQIPGNLQNGIYIVELKSGTLTLFAQQLIVKR